MGEAGANPHPSPTKTRELHAGSFLPLPADSQVKRPFVVLKGKDGERKLSSLSVFVIDRQLRAIVGSDLQQIQKLGSGELLIQCKSNEQAQKLFDAKKFGDIPCVAESHRSLNQSKGIIRSPQLKNETEEGLTEGIEGVVHSRRMSVWRKGSSHQTNSFLLTFDSCTPPSKVKVAWMRLDVQTYIPNPMRCFKCQKFGHSKVRCRHRQVCAKCGVAGHEQKECKNEICCPNCNGAHTAFDKQCPEWIKEKEIQRYKAENGCTFPEARTAVCGPEQFKKKGISYAKVVQKGMQADTQKPSKDENSAREVNDPEPKKSPRKDLFGKKKVKVISSRRSGKDLREEQILEENRFFALSKEGTGLDGDLSVSSGPSSPIPFYGPPSPSVSLASQVSPSQSPSSKPPSQPFDSIWNLPDPRVLGSLPPAAKSAGERESGANISKAGGSRPTPIPTPEAESPKPNQSPTAPNQRSGGPKAQTPQTPASKAGQMSTPSQSPGGFPPQSPKTGERGVGKADFQPPSGAPPKALSREGHKTPSPTPQQSPQQQNSAAKPPGSAKRKQEQYEKPCPKSKKPAK